ASRRSLQICATPSIRNTVRRNCWHSRLTILKRVTPIRPECGSNCRKITDRKSTRLNSSHVSISYAVFCLKKKKFEYRQPDLHQRPTAHQILPTAFTLTSTDQTTHFPFQ